MTVKEKGLARLYECGLFQDQAEAIMELVIADPANKSMKERWNDAIEDYPQALWNVLWLSIKRVTRKYIEEHCPEAWFRSMFEG